MSYFSYLTQASKDAADTNEEAEDADLEDADELEDGEVAKPSIENVEPKEAAQLSTLKLYLRSCTPANLLDNTSFPLHLLHSAVHLAAREIRQTLDPELEAVVHGASEKQHCIQLDEDAFWRRPLDVDALTEDAIKKHDYQETCWLLEMCRDDIAWLENEGRRLEAHCEIARQVLKSGERKSFAYVPTPRKEAEKNWWKEEDVGKKEGEDKEMLDAGETKQQDPRGRYDSKIAPTWEKGL